MFLCQGYLLLLFDSILFLKSNECWCFSTCLQILGSLLKVYARQNHIMNGKKNLIVLLLLNIWSEPINMHQLHWYEIMLNQATIT
jgi:hypothetical protein